MSKASRQTPVLLAAIVLLAGCASPVVVPPRQSETWGFAAADGEWPAKLIYGLADTDVVSLGFTCLPGSGEAKILVFVGEDERTWPDRLELRSGAARQAFALSPPTEADVPTLEASIDAAAPIAVSFAGTGQLESSLGDTRRKIDANDRNERGDVTQFWRACAKSR